MAAVRDKTTFGLELFVFRVGVLSESPFTRDDDLLTSRELVLAAAKGLYGILNGGSLCSHGNQNLVDLYAGNQALGLSEGVTHTSLESIGSGTGKHFVDTENVIGVDTDAHMEGISASHLLHVLVSADTGSFEGFAGDLFLLERNQVDADYNLSLNKGI